MISMDTIEEQVMQALQYLSDRCDGASSIDNMGFNGGDSSFGKSLASKSFLSDAMLLAGHKMLQKYKTQLEGGDIELPSREEVEAFVKERRENPTQTIITASGQKEVVAIPEGSIKVDDDCIIVSWPKGTKNFAKKLEVLRTVKLNKIGVTGKSKPAFYDGNGGWICPIGAADYIMKELPELEVDPKLQDAVENKELETEAQRREREDQIKRVLSALGDMTQPMADGRVPFQHQREAVEFMIKHNNHGGILALDIGLGKTYTSLLTAKAYQKTLGCAVFIVCPPKLKTVWLREASALGVSIETFSSANIPEPPEYKEYVLFADEAHQFQNIQSLRTKKFIALAHAKNCIAAFPVSGTPSRNGKPANLMPLLIAIEHPIVADRREYEKRYCGAGPTRFSQWDTTGATNLEELHEKTKKDILYRKKRDCLDMPATMRVMVPVGLSAEASKLLASSLKSLAEKHEEAVKTKVALMAEEYPEHVHNLLESAIYAVRKGKVEKFKKNADKFGENYFHSFNFEVAEAALTYIEMTMKNENLLIEDIHSGMDIFKKLQEVNARHKERFEEIAREADSLVELGQMVHSNSLAKAEAAAELAEDLLEENQQVVIFTTFQDTAELITTKLAENLKIENKFMPLTGKTVKQSDGIIDRFQAGEPKSVYDRVFIGTYGAAGVGITLNKAQDLILVDRVWVPTDIEQAEGRIDRIGQQGPTTMHWLQQGEIDDKIDKVVDEKQDNIDVILEGKVREKRAANKGITPKVAERIIQEMMHIKK